MSSIDKLIDAAIGNELLSMMDALSRYNQILTNESNEENAAFITKWGNFCYRMMSFSILNAGLTFQRLKEMVFKNQIDRNVLAYVDGILVKSVVLIDHAKI